MIRIAELCRKASDMTQKVNQPFYRRAASGGIPRRCATVALVIGALLYLINQGDAIFSDGAVSWTKLALTFLVPYAVCTYGALSARESGPRGASSDGA